jgi:hypothetical protein
VPVWVQLAVILGLTFVRIHLGFAALKGFELVINLTTAKALGLGRRS